MPIYVKTPDQRVRPSDEIIRVVKVTDVPVTSPLNLNPPKDAGGILLGTEMGIAGKLIYGDGGVLADEPEVAELDVEVADQDYTVEEGGIKTLAGNIIPEGTVLKKGSFIFVSHTDNLYLRDVLFTILGSKR